MQHAVIMAGGIGSRLWPLSRAGRPKQMLPLAHGTPLLQAAWDRLDGAVPMEHRWVCTGAEYAEGVHRILPDLVPAHLLGEPSPRDTVNAIAFSAATMLAQDPDAVLAVLTADQVIEPADTFQKGLAAAYAAVEREPEALLTFAIEPTFPATGYGWVERREEVVPGVFAVDRFVEKPDLETATALLADGGFGWNSGMFVFRADTFLSAMRAYFGEGVDQLLEIGKGWAEGRGAEVLEAHWETLPKKSVDYAVMEPAAAGDRFPVRTVPLPVAWHDLGSWPSLDPVLNVDDAGNRTQGLVTHLDSKNCVCVNEDQHHRITTIGCEDLVVVHTTRATLVCPRDEAQRVKELRNLLPEDER